MQPVLTRTIGPGERHGLGFTDEGSDAMRVRFRGHNVSIDAGPEEEVLFPTGVGLALLAGLDGHRDLELDGRRVLDIGCGSGLYSVAALAAGAAQVSSLDVSEACVRTTLSNITANGLSIDAVEPLVADLAYMEVAQRWDVVVLANPPHYPDDPSYSTGNGLGTALVGGPDGRALYNVLLARLDDLLLPGGALVLAHSSLTNVARSTAELTARGHACRTALIVELDMPLRHYADHRAVLLARLYDLRRQGHADFTGLQFEVHVLIAKRANAKGDL